MNETKNQLREDSIEFAIRVSDLCDEIKGCAVFVNQVVRSSSSIGANIHEAKYAQSRADFINKLETEIEHCWLNGHREKRLPNNVHFGFELKDEGVRWYVEGEFCG